MLRILYIVLFLSGLTFHPVNTHAQISELGGILGMTSYKGDLKQNMFTTNLIDYHSAFGIFIRRNTNAHWAYRFNLMKGKVSGYDSRSSSGFAKKRNLSFIAPIYEFAFTFEFNFFPFEKYGSPYLATPYVFAGYSFFYFNPKGIYNGQEYKLRAMQLEGANYSSLARAIPMGVGVKYKAGGWILAAEIGARKTTTDFLDNVSGTYLANNSFKGAAKNLSNPSTDTTIVNIAGRQRGNSKDKDWYVFVGATVSRHIGNFRKNECQRLLKNM